MTTLAIDWLALKNRIGEENLEAPTLVCVPRAGAFLLLSIGARLRWESTFRNGEYDFSDWDNLQRIVEDTMGALSEDNMIDLTQIEETLEQLVAAVQAQNNTTLLEIQCCENNVTRDQLPESDVEKDVGNPPISPDWPTFNDYLCSAGYGLADELALRCYDLRALQSAGIGGIASLTAVFAAWFAVFVGVVLSEAAAITDFFSGVADVNFWQELGEKFENNEVIRAAIACALVESQNPLDAYGKYQIKIGELVGQGELTALEGEAAKILIVSGVMETIYNQQNPDGEPLDFSKYDDKDCSACGQVVLGFVDYIPVLGGAPIAGWNGMSGSTVWYDDGVRSSDNYNACSTDGWCEDADYYGNVGLSQNFTPNVNLRVTVNQSRETSFGGQVDVVISSGGTVQHTQTLPDSRFSTDSTEINFDCLAGTTYDIFITGNNARMMIVSILGASS